MVADSPLDCLSLQKCAFAHASQW